MSEEVLDESLWKDIPGYEGYQTHPSGEIRNKKTKRISVGESKKHPYRLIKIHRKPSTSIHRLVALTFVPNPENKPVVNHIDENKRNNRSDNLEWCTYSENITHSIANKKKIINGYNSGPLRFTFANGNIKEFNSLTEACSNLKTHRTAMHRALNGDGYYYGSSKAKNKTIWIWKVEKLPYPDSKELNKDIKEIEINIPGLQHLIACSDGEIINKITRRPIGKQNNSGYIIASGMVLHRIIALTFIPNPDNKPFVNHIDGNKTNNSVDNLEWCTNSENMNHARNAGLNNYKSVKNKVKVYQLNLDYSIVKQFDSLTKATEETLADSSHISAICKNYKAGIKTGGKQISKGFRWCYAEDYREPEIKS